MRQEMHPSVYVRRDAKSGMPKNRAPITAKNTRKLLNRLTFASSVRTCLRGQGKILFSSASRLDYKATQLVNQPLVMVASPSKSTDMTSVNVASVRTIKSTYDTDPA